MRNNTYGISRENGHYVVRINGEFYCSADTITEAAHELEQYKNEDSGQE